MSVGGPKSSMMAVSMFQSRATKNTHKHQRPVSSGPAIVVVVVVDVERATKTVYRAMKVFWQISSTKDAECCAGLL